MNRFRTEGFQGYSVDFSPFFEYRLACASSANFGIVGNGRLWILAMGPEGVRVERVYDTQDGMFDSAWSETHENQIATSSGDGSVKLWDVSLPDLPIRSWQEHKREVFAVNWNLVRKDTFITGSWDHSIKLWSPEAPSSIRTWQEHNHCIYNTVWSPYNADVFASASGDNTIKLWDLRAPQSAQTVRAHNNEVLAIDWNKYNEHSVVTGSVDNSVKVFDWRFPQREVLWIQGAHEFAVRRIKCSPHNGGLVASASYDMSVRFWDISKVSSPVAGVPPGGQLRFNHSDHTEFALGVDFNLYVPGQVATCAWDEQVHVFPIPT
ncbi:WD40-repeat-containing domain protein [Cladochytrium replicatum]|nr:WD40-repeat-containing domain protein [Cladochytrium replicatum]